MVNLLAGRTTHPAFRIYHTAWQAADWLFPPSCTGCGKFGFRWCPDCEKEIQAIPLPFCPVCNQSVSRPGKCNNCKAENPAFSTLRSLGSYTGPLRKAVLQIKYRHDIGVCEIFAFKLLNLVESELDQFDYQSATLHFGYLMRRNVRLVAEGTYIFSGTSYAKASLGFVSAF
jgi:hypothetical protein